MAEFIDFEDYIDDEEGLREALLDYLEEECDYDREELEENDLEELKSMYEDYVEEITDDSTMFPNGRDYDAEDFDD